MSSPHPDRRPTDLSGVFAPKSIALVGASRDESKLTGRPQRILARHAYPGPVYPINPRYAEIEGQTCYPHIAAVPSAVDLALIMTPAASVPQSLQDCGAAGVRNAIIISSGFEEAAEGQSLSAQLREVAAEYGINVVGPNCEGVWSVPQRAIMTFGSAALDGDILDGPVSVLSQSGSIGGSTVMNLQRRGIGCRYFVSLGNETVLGALDFLEYVVDDGGSRVVLLFVEGLHDGHRLRGLAERAQRRGIDIVILKTGASREGQLASASHTGKIASPQAVYSSIFEQCGVIEVDTINDLTEAAATLLTARLGPSRRDGNAGVGIVAPGGSRGVIADECERRGVPLATFTERTEATLREVVPTFGSVRNPVDATGQVLTQKGMFESVIHGIATDPGTEALLVQYSNRGLRRLPEIRRLFAADGVVPEGTPTIVGFLGDADALPGEHRRGFAEAGVIATLNPETAVKYLAWLYRSRDARERAQRRPALSSPPLAEATPATAVGAAEMHSWRWQTAFLAAAGIPTPRWALVDGVESVAQALSALRLPVAAKALPEEVDHKSDLGLVHLGLHSLDQVAEAVRDLLGQPSVRLSAVLLQEMVVGGYEALVSARDDPDFGPVLSVGSGGTLVELIADVVHVAIPCTDEELREALHRTKLATVLGGLRGRPPGDTEALIAALRSFSSAYLSCHPRPTVLELNPLVVGATGSGVSALDVLVS